MLHILVQWPIVRVLLELQKYVSQHLAVVANTSCSAGLNRSESIESAPQVNVLIGSDLTHESASNESKVIINRR
jgi:hypothetical protein